MLQLSSLATYFVLSPSQCFISESAHHLCTFIFRFKYHWLILQGSDPSTYEMIQKIQTLQKRLISKTEEVSRPINELINQTINQLINQLISQSVSLLMKNPPFSQLTQVCKTLQINHNNC